MNKIIQEVLIRDVRITRRKGMSNKNDVCRLSIASLISGLLGIFPAAIVCGHLALRKMRKEQHSGKDLAVAGLFLGYLVLLLLVTGAVLLATAEPLNSIDTPEIVRMLEEEESVASVYMFLDQSVRIQLDDGTEYNGTYVHRNAGKYALNPRYTSIYDLVLHIKEKKNAQWKAWAE